jgi:hypothetical protein
LRSVRAVKRCLWKHKLWRVCFGSEKRFKALLVHLVER